MVPFEFPTLEPDSNSLLLAELAPSPPPRMNYGAEAYENPPAPVPAAVETNTLGGEIFDDPKRPELPKKKQVSVKDAIMQAHG